MKNLTKLKNFLFFILSLSLIISILPTNTLTAIAADNNTVTVGGVDLTVNETVTVAYATNDSTGTVTTAGVNSDNYTIKFELADGIPTLTLLDATINNGNGDGIKANGTEITINGVDTSADGSNTISGSVNGISSAGNIIITGTVGDITGGSNGGIYSTEGNITIAKDAVVGNLTSDWYTLQTDKGNITIDGKVGNISGVIGITSEYNHDVIITGEVGNISGSDYGIFAYKNLTIAPKAKVGNISGGAGGIMAIADINIDGSVDSASGTHGIYAMGNIDIKGYLNNVTGQCAIRAINGNIDISGTVGAISGNGGTANTGSSYGIRADGGKISIKNVVGPISADSDGQGVTIIAILANKGIELANNIKIKTPINNKMDKYNDAYYTVFDSANTEAANDDIVAKKVEFTYVYTVTFVVDGNTLTTVQVPHGTDVKLPEIPAKNGYTASWDKDGKTITTDTIITAVYTPIVEKQTPAKDTPASPPTGDNATATMSLFSMVLSLGIILSTLYFKKKTY